jgi:glycine cleavage system regulatory protein
MGKESKVVIEVIYSNREITMESLSKIFNNKNIVINSIESSKYNETLPQVNKYFSCYTITVPKHIDIKTMIHEVMALENVQSVSLK